MTDQITVIDLDESDYEEEESYQDKIAKLEAKVSQMEQEINGFKEMIADLKNSSEEDSKGYSPICTTMHPNFNCNAQHFSNMHPLWPKEAFNGLTETRKDGENGGRHFNVETNQVSFINELALQIKTDSIEMENENENPYDLVDIPMYDGGGSPLNHLNAYFDWLSSIGQDNELKTRLFVRTLTGPALMWYVKQDTWKWFSWGDLAKDFVKQYWSPNDTSKGIGLLKRKSTESPEGPKGKEPYKKAAKSILEHDKINCCSVEAKSKDKGKTTIREALNAPPAITPMPGHSQTAYPQFVGRIFPHSQATVGPRTIAPSLCFHTFATRTCDIARWSTTNGFIEEDY